MAFKFVILAAFVAAANAGNLLGASLAGGIAYGAAPLAYAAPVANVVAKTVVNEEYDPNPQYSYGYQVQDALTGDSKSQSETRNGDVVQGSYSLVDADGTLRTVEYTADPLNGFNAVVHKTPLGVKSVVAAPVVAKTVVAAPAIARVHAPLAVASPILRAASPLATSVVHGINAAPAIASYGAPLLRSSNLIGASPYGAATSVVHGINAAPAVASYGAPLLGASPYASASLIGASPYASGSLLRAAPLGVASSTIHGSPLLRSAPIW